ncbi:MAG: response regulator transcription factor [Myxococcales bacterium]|nr:response regulator transcription factor [Myxococcales bacterium]
MSESARILLIEDDTILAEHTIQYLENFGFFVQWEEEGPAGLQAAKEAPFDVLLLDLMLPGMDGLEICRQLRAEERTSHIPILMLTARGDETDRIVGLEIGADDYLAKPFSLRELVARIRAILRRIQLDQETQSPPPSPLPEPSTETLEIGCLQLNQATREAFCRGEPIELTASEFDLLWLLVSRPQHVWKREQLLDEVRGREFEAFDRSVDVHISKLRKKIERDPKNPSMIQTVWGVGYRFLPED